MKRRFELIAFHANIEDTKTLAQCGIDGIIIDWERKGKKLRQQLFNTQINQHTEKDLKAISKEAIPHIICRLNPQTKVNPKEIFSAIDLGANELLIPMVRHAQEIEKVLNLVQNRAKVSIMLETQTAFQEIYALNNFPLERIYIGLNDLKIAMNSEYLFAPIANGMLDSIRPSINKKFGFAGLTHPTLGKPIPCKVLLEEMKRLNADFGILRRSFYKDAKHHSLAEIISALRKELIDYPCERLQDITPTKNQELLFSKV
jgi:2-keto-3-deoxy-L-rhamnonate aldolase RhmA